MLVSNALGRRFAGIGACVAAVGLAALLVSCGRTPIDRDEPSEVDTSPDVICADASCVEDCTNGLDDDGNGWTDCEDPACAGVDPACALDTCRPQPLGTRTGFPIVSGSTMGDTNSVSGSCGGATAPDDAWRWQAPVAGDWRFRLETRGNHLGALIVLDGTCQGAELACVAEPDVVHEAVLSLRAGQRVVIVADGDGGSAGPYELGVELVGDDCVYFHAPDGTYRPDCSNRFCDQEPECQVPTPEDCTNGRDDNGDGRVDCEDPQCFDAPSCRPPSPETNCSNRIDDDGNGLTDCEDPACERDPFCEQGTDCIDIRIREVSAPLTLPFLLGREDRSRYQPQCSAAVGPDFLVTFVPQRDAIYEFGVTEADFDPILSLHGLSETRCLVGDSLACVDDTDGQLPRFRRALPAGQRVLVAVDGFNGAWGRGVLNIRRIDPEP